MIFVSSSLATVSKTAMHWTFYFVFDIFYTVVPGLWCLCKYGAGKMERKSACSMQAGDIPNMIKYAWFWSSFIRIWIFNARHCFTPGSVDGAGVANSHFTYIWKAQKAAVRYLFWNVRRLLQTGWLTEHMRFRQNLPWLLFYWSVHGTLVVAFKLLKR